MNALKEETEKKKLETCQYMDKVIQSYQKPLLQYVFSYDTVHMTEHMTVYMARFWESEISLPFYEIIPCHGINSVSLLPCDPPTF